MPKSDSNATSMRDKLRQIPSLEAPLPNVDIANFPKTPQMAFVSWLDDVLAAGVKEPHAMTLSTMDENGWPDARVLILKNIDTRGWHFSVKAESPKSRQIERVPQVALAFYWPMLGRQIRLRSEAVALSTRECADDFFGTSH